MHEYNAIPKVLEGSKGQIPARLCLLKGMKGMFAKLSSLPVIAVTCIKVLVYIARCLIYLGIQGKGIKHGNWYTTLKLYNHTVQSLPLCSLQINTHQEA